jgi:hypothetical protein
MGLKAGQFDIETAFLYGDLEEELRMVMPDGYEEYNYEKYGKRIDGTKQCLKLKKSLYGLVQAARQWRKKFKEVMKGIGFLPSEIDPCLFIKDKGNNQKAIVIIYINDGGIFGNNEDIKQMISALSKTFTVKDLWKLEHFIGCHMIEDIKNKNKMYIHQPKLLKHLHEEFKHLIGKPKQYKTPAGPKTCIIRPAPEDKLIKKQEQTIYRSGVGMLLYLVKHS